MSPFDKLARYTTSRGISLIMSEHGDAIKPLGCCVSFRCMQPQVYYEFIEANPEPRFFLQNAGSYPSLAAKPSQTGLESSSRACFAPETPSPQKHSISAKFNALWGEQHAEIEYEKVALHNLHNACPCSAYMGVNVSVVVMAEYGISKCQQSLRA